MAKKTEAPADDSYKLTNVVVPASNMAPSSTSVASSSEPPATLPMKESPKPRMQMRHELKAMHKIDELMESLPPDARVRVITWLTQVHTQDPGPTPGYDKGPPDAA